MYVSAAAGRNGNNLKVLRCFPSNPGPDSGPNCLMVCQFASRSKRRLGEFGNSGEGGGNGRGWGASRGRGRSVRREAGSSVPRRAHLSRGGPMHLAHKKASNPQDHRRSSCIGLLGCLWGGRFIEEGERGDEG